ncbi:hypothetical protein OCU04_006004 [Sclerotinia nivalis]|uniref:Uncharacterized protein n=1 Tax=Sclerotinia nivalis TaxID=352851 RepID=A0A9X0DLQ8_9HELO|nr:hypothetical protein OCU04_006004 [Sclerotinia nivalis]
MLYDWDLRGNIPDIKITPLIEPENWHIRWELPEPEVTAPTKLLLLTIQQNIQDQITYDKYLAQQLAEKEDGIDVPQGLEDANFTDEEEIHDHSTDIQHDTEAVSGDNLIYMENGDVDMAGWILLPFHDDDEFFSPTYQMDDNQFHFPSSHTAAAGTDEDSERNYFEELFRNDESLCSQYEDDADGEIVESIQEHINSGGSILHVLPWLKESHSSLSHVVPWLADLQE